MSFFKSIEGATKLNSAQNTAVKFVIHVKCRSIQNQEKMAKVDEATVTASLAGDRYCN
jgi:hypothetical protein